MPFSVGVDGGQSGIRVAFSDSNAVAEFPGVSRLEGDADEAVVDAVVSACSSRGRPQRIVAGLTAIPPTDESRRILARRLVDASGADEVWVGGDVATTHAGAFAGESGVVAAVGTGAIAMALDVSTGRHRVYDGAGYLLGDEGGGFWIGRHGIRAALADHERRGPETTLTAAVIEAFGPLDGLADRVHAMPRAVDTIAQTARIVLEHAGRGDAVAVGIVEEAASRLLNTVAAGLAFLGEDSRVRLSGRLLTATPILSDRLVAAIEARYGPVAALAADGAGVEGARRLAGGQHSSVYQAQFTVENA